MAEVGTSQQTQNRIEIQSNKTVKFLFGFAWISIPCGFSRLFLLMVSVAWRQSSHAGPGKSGPARAAAAVAPLGYEPNRETNFLLLLNYNYITAAEQKSCRSHKVHLALGRAWSDFDFEWIRWMLCKKMFPNSGLKDWSPYFGKLDVWRSRFTALPMYPGRSRSRRQKKGGKFVWR